MAETAGSTVHHIADPEVATSARWPGWPMPTQTRKLPERSVRAAGQLTRTNHWVKLGLRGSPLPGGSAQLPSHRRAEMTLT